MRTLTAPAIAALNTLSTTGALPLAVLVEMELSSPLYLNTSSLDMVLGGVTYYGTRGLGTIETVIETPAEVRPLKFTLSGVPSTSVALVLTEPVQGKAVTVKLAIFDPATYQVLDVRTRWAGRLDVMTLDEDGGTATVSVTAEHVGVDYTRPGNSYYTDAEQQRLYPGDLAFQFLNDQVEQRIVWPSLAFGRQ